MLTRLTGIAVHGLNAFAENTKLMKIKLCKPRYLGGIKQNQFNDMENAVVNEFRV